MPPDNLHDISYDKALYDWLRRQLFLAYLDARAGKRCTEDEHRYELNSLANTDQLARDILTRSYYPSRGIAFVTHRPVIREIFAAPFRDRVVHHFLFNMNADWWDKRFINDSYSCRVGKGTLYGIMRLAKMIKRVSQNYTRPAYVIKLDIQGYFMSLPRKGLYERIMWGLNRQFPDRSDAPGLLGDIYNICKFLWHRIIYDNPCAGVQRRGSTKSWKELPASKSLFCQPPGQGIVIGNLSSQLLSNIYLDQLDRFVVYNLGYRNYGRYVDDFFLIVDESQYRQALNSIEVISNFLLGIGLTLHPKKRYIQPVSRGVPFLGVVIYPDHIVVDDRLKRNFREAMHLCAQGKKDTDILISYFGHLQHFDAEKLKHRIFHECGWDYHF